MCIKPVDSNSISNFASNSIGISGAILGITLIVIGILGALQVIPHLNVLQGGVIAGASLAVFAITAVVVWRMRSKVQQQPKVQEKVKVGPENNNVEKPKVQPREVKNTDRLLTLPKPIQEIIFSQSDSLGTVLQVDKRWNRIVKESPRLAIQRHRTVAKEVKAPLAKSIGVCAADFDHTEHLADIHYDLAKHRIEGMKDFKKSILSQTNEVQVELNCKLAAVTKDPSFIKSAKEVKIYSEERLFNYHIAKQEVQFDPQAAIETLKSRPLTIGYNREEKYVYYEDFVTPLACQFLQGNLEVNPKDISETLNKAVNEQLKYALIKDIVLAWAIAGHVDKAKELLEGLKFTGIDAKRAVSICCALACIDPQHDFSQAKRINEMTGSHSYEHAYLASVEALFDPKSARETAKTIHKADQRALAFYNIACISHKIEDFAEAIKATNELSNKNDSLRSYVQIGLAMVHCKHNETKEFWTLLKNAEVLYPNWNVLHALIKSLPRDSWDKFQPRGTDFHYNWLDIESVRFCIDWLERELAEDVSGVAVQLFKANKLKEGQKLNALFAWNIHPAHRKNIHLDFCDAIQSTLKQDN